MDVDDGLLPLAGLDLALEENVDLSVRSVLHLRKPDVCHDQADETGTSPDIAALATEVGASGVKHPRGEEDTGDVDEVVAATADTSGERSKTNSGRFSDDDPRGGSGSEGEEDGDNETEGSLGVGVDGGLDITDSGGDTESDQEDSVSERAPEVNGSTTEVTGENPRKHDEDGLEGGGDETHSESGLVRHTGLLEEVDSLVSDQVTSEVLSGVNAANDGSTVSISALE